MAKALRGAIETSRVGHAYLFTGARGVGKTSTARIFAKALNQPDGASVDPALASDLSDAIDSGEDVDVIEIDGASNRGIDEIRQLRANVSVRPSRSRFKIYIIDEVHMLTGAAFNALLKTLEEPPEHVKFIFCTTDPDKIPITVLSRCQRFDFAPVAPDQIVGRLSEIVANENATAEPSALELIARRAAGSMRDSQSLLEQVLSFSDGHLTADLVHQLLGMADDQRLHALTVVLTQRDAGDAIRLVDEAMVAGIDAGRLAEQLLGFLRDIMTVGVGCDESMLRYCAVSMHGELKTLAESWGLQTLLAVIGIIDETLVRIRHSVHARVLLESAVVQICSLPDLQLISDLAAATSGEKKKLILSATKARTAPNPVASTSPPSPDSPAPARPAPPGFSGNDLASGNEATVRIDGGTGDPVVPAPKSLPSAAPAPAHVLAATDEMAASPILSPDRFDQVWNAAIAEMDPMTVSLTRAAKVTCSSKGVVQLKYPGDSKLAFGRCEAPENRNEIVATLQRIVGKPVPVQIELDARLAPKPKQAAAKPKSRNRMQLMKEIESKELVKACMEMMGAEIIRVDAPRQ